MTRTASHCVGGIVRFTSYLLSCIPIACVAVLACGGCKVGPNYRPPQVPIPDSFKSGPATQPAGQTPTTQPALDLARWWSSLDDPVLDGLIRSAVEGNIDLMIALARVQEVRYAQDVAAASLFPFVGFASGGPGRQPLYSRASQTLWHSRFYTRPRGNVQLREPITGNGLGAPSLFGLSSGRLGLGALVAPGQAGQPGSITPRLEVRDRDQVRIVDMDQYNYEAVLQATWELDVFGGVRRAIEAANADTQATVETRNDLLMMLIGDTASAYMEYRGLQRRLEIAKSNIGRQEWMLGLVQTRLQNGLTSDLDLRLARRELASVKARLPVLHASIENAQHRLSVLLGMPPEELPVALTEPGKLPLPPSDVPSGLPSDLLRQRPDVRRAERELAAATARIGVATARLYPQFSLTGSFGFQTSDIRRLLDANSMVWSGGPGVSWPIFQGGQLIGTVRIREAQAQVALLRYRSVLLGALQEVEDALSNYAGQRGRYLELLQAVEESAGAFRLAQDRYDKGLTDFLNVLDAQRVLYALEDEAAISHQGLMMELVNLYRALGRGWEVPPSPGPATQPSA